MLMDSVRKTKARDKKIAEITAERDELAAKSAGVTENGLSSPVLDQELQVSALA